MIPFRIQLGVIAALWAGSALAIGTAVTVQGTLDDAGVPANGVYDLTFQVRTTSGTNVGPLVTVEDRTVALGVFTVQVDFGTGVFNGNDRVITVGVRPGASSGAFTLLSPDIPVQPAPYAQVSSNSELADLALDVTDNAIDEVDIGTAAVSARNIATDAVGAAEIASGAVGADEIASSAVGSSEIASAAVGTSELENNAVTAAKLAGDFNISGVISLSVGANSCRTDDIGYTGIQAGDFVFLNITDGLPAGMFIIPLRAPAANTMRIRSCNVSGSTATATNLDIRGSWIR